MDKVPKKITSDKVKVTKTTQTKTELVLPVKKVTTKKIKTKIEAKAKTSLKPKASALKKKLPIKKVVSKAAQNSDELKFVPGTISLRLAEKRKLYERVYQDYVPKVMRPIALTSGYVYITIGIFLALLMANPALSNLVSQTASVLCFSGDCKTATTTESVTEQAIKPVEFLPLPPILPGSDTNLQLALNLVVPVQISILPISGGETMIISGVSESATNIVNFLLPTATLTNGSYLLSAELYDEETKQIRAKLLGPTIVVQNVVVQEVVVSEEVELEDILSEENVIDDGEVLGVSTSTSETDLESGSDVSGEDDLVAIESDDEVEAIKVVPADDSKVFVLTVVPGTTPNQSVLKIIPTFVFEKVELALKLKGDGEIFYLGQATKTDDSWLYWLDNTTIPNGTYSLTVRGFDNGGLSEESTTFILSNEVKLELTKQADLDEIVSRVESLLAEGLDVEEITELRATYATSYIKTGENEFSDDYLSDYLQKFDRLFLKYAAAVAGQNESLIILADDQLEKYLDTVIVDSEAEDGFSQELLALTLRIKDYIRTNEEEIRKQSGGDSAFDIDKDGLTDYDEVTIYDTDPKLPDTDNDGYLDSVEIVLGYDPTDAKLEVVSRFDTGSHSGVLNGEILAISAIEPFYFYTDANSNPKVFTSVSGKAVPNSFARLYLGNSSESVIVKVGPNGTFTQTIDKDFVKVEGEVVLALTDNTGTIVMRGQPLQLDKVITTKQLFNPAVIDAAVIKSVEDFQTSNIIGAVGVVSFGLILLLLGKALVPRREPISLEIA